ncbi:MULTISPECIES: TIGR02679 family protein [unclassified Variovorax]|uniref:TIGR02679 family protein n=1 Tax=unclassified Variovorax TaxID=663243 RepID=UPI001BD5BC2E|nr:MULTISPECIES: TIGR02679 family protein [unclassified Variovorax]
MATPDPRLQRLLGGLALAALRQRLRRHFERGGTAEGALLLGQLQPAEREALALLSGRPAKAARSLRLDLAELQARLQAAGIAGSLREALEHLDGPITDLVAERDAQQSTWLAMLSRTGRDPRLQAWLQAGTAAGLLKRLSRQDADAADILLSQAGKVLGRMPATGLPRSQLAAQVLGDAHALDAGRPVAALVLAAWRHGEAIRDMPAVDAGDGDFDDTRDEPLGPAADERARDIWARAGVLVNELARPVLVLNLPVPVDLDTVPWLRGEPAYLSLRWLLRAAPRWDVADRTVFVCENPNLLAIAAEQLGTRCAPLICTDGMPAAAQRTLLQQLVRSGARLRYHGDFDWAGLRIANHVLRHAGAAPWRMGMADYETAARAAAPARHTLTGSETEAVWDVQLAPAMRRHGLAIAEEAVAESLFNDLSLS